VISLVKQDDNDDEHIDEGALITRPSVLSSAEKDEVERLRSYNWFDDVNREKAIALGRKAQLAASTGAACDWQSFRDQMLSIYYYDQACRACSLDKTFHPLPADMLRNSITTEPGRTFAIRIRPLTWTGASPEAAIVKVREIKEHAPPDDFFMLDHLENRYWSDSIGEHPPDGATVYACYGCWVIEVARWWYSFVGSNPEAARMSGEPLFANKWGAQKFLRR
jgi:hypothetical protein